jgi:hypothetical protein
MMYETAVKKLRVSNYYYSSIEFQTNIFNATPTDSKLRLYVVVKEGDTGFWTEWHKDFAGAFSELNRHLAGELPEYADEAPAGFIGESSEALAQLREKVPADCENGQVR